MYKVHSIESDLMNVNNYFHFLISFEKPLPSHFLSKKVLFLIKGPSVHYGNPRVTKTVLPLLPSSNRQIKKSSPTPKFPLTPTHVTPSLPSSLTYNSPTIPGEASHSQRLP